MAGKVIDVTMRLIDKVTTPLNNVNAKLTASSKQWQRAGKDIQKAGRSISNTGKSLTKTVTAPIVGVGAASVKLAADFESSMDKVQSISGATGSEMDKLSELAKEMGAKTKFSATEAADAYSYMAMAGWKTSDMLNGLEGIMYLSGATGEDLASTSDIVTDALTAFGMSTSETNKLVDTLAATASNANTDVAMLGESFKYAAPVAGALGFSSEDLSLSLGLMANAGIKASQAGTSMRSWMSNMSAPTASVTKAMETLGISLTDSEGKMKSLKTILGDTRTAFSGLTESEKAMYAKTLAGKNGMSGLLAVVNSSDKDFNKLADAINNSNGACEEMYNVAQDNLNGQLTILKSTLESIGISIGERLTPYVKRLTEFLQKCADKFNSLSDSQKDAVIKAALFAASIGPVLLIIGGLTSHIGRAVTNIGRLGANLKKFGGIAGIITSPAGIVVASIAAIVAIGILVIKNWDKIKEKAELLKNFVGVRLKKLGIDGESMGKKLEPIKDKFNAIVEHGKKLWSVLHPHIQKLGQAFHQIFMNRIGKAITFAAGIFQGLFSSVSSIVSGIMSVLDGIITFITGVFSGNWSKAWKGVKSIFSGIFESLAGVASAPINAIIGLINGVIGNINSVSIKIPKWVPKFGGNTYSPSIPTIPTLAAGTDYWKGGLVQISEKGGEIVDLPSGSRVYPHDKSVKQAYKDGASKGRIVIAKLADQIVVREDADIDKIVSKLADKLEEIAANTGGGELGYNY